MFNKQKLLSILPLTIISIVCFCTIVVVHHYTKEKISINKEYAALTVIIQVLSAKYDNDVSRQNKD